MTNMNLCYLKTRIKERKLNHVLLMVKMEIVRTNVRAKKHL
jgi:hypothetical protein